MKSSTCTPSLEEIYSFFNFGVIWGMGNQRHAPAALHPEKNQYPLYRRLGGFRAGLDGCGKSRPTGTRSPDRPACSESLYQLRYPGPQMCSLRRHKGNGGLVKHEFFFRRILDGHNDWTKSCNRESSCFSHHRSNCDHLVIQQTVLSLYGHIFQVMEDSLNLKQYLRFQ